MSQGTEHVETDVCIVGAGYAGLTAARRLKAAGRAVLVLEARDRVGGRVWTQHRDGHGFDVGGTWVGAGQDAVRALASEVGVGTYPTYHGGDDVMVLGDRVHRFRGLVPRINPLVIASLTLGMARLDRMAKAVPIDAPWDARRAGNWDDRSAGSWLRTNMPNRAARDLLAAAVRGLMTCDPSEVSLLHLLYLVRSANGLSKLLSIEGGYQQDHFEGGAQRVADLMAAELGDALRLGVPVRAVDRDVDGVDINADGLRVRAVHLVMTIPPALAARVRYEPALPPDRAQLLDRMPAGSVRKLLLVYPDAFWRADGLSGQSVAAGTPIEMTLDASPHSGAPGVLASFAFGPYARQLRARTADERRRVVLDAARERFGGKASEPMHFIEQEWATEEWSRGGMMAHLAPGVLTQFGRLIRMPVGRIHWAGTETSTVSHGTIDGAVRSGERAAREVLAAAG